MSDYRGLVSHKNRVGLHRMLDYRGVELLRFHCTRLYVELHTSLKPQGSKGIIWRMG